MASKRPWHCYSKLIGPTFQRKRSRSHRREYARGGADPKIRMYEGGRNLSERKRKDWEVIAGLKAENDVQISHYALEAIRITINSSLQKKIGRQNYHLTIKIKPFHVIRENRQLNFAGADRVQSGMRNSFGKSIGKAARVRAGQIICELMCNLKDLPLIKDRLRIANIKMPCKCQTVLLHYANDDALKGAGLPFYDEKKKRIISPFELEEITLSTVKT
jgi:large subunit ribosomal protein L10e